MFKLVTLSLFADPPDLNPHEPSHPKPHQHKPRRGRSRYSNDRNLSSNASSSQHYGNFQQGFKPPYSHDYSNSAVHQHSPNQEEDGARRRGRGKGRREGNRSVNGNFGGSSSSWQRPGGYFSHYGGNNQGAGAYQSEAHAMDGLDGPNWRRDADKTQEQAHEDQDAQVKKPRKFSQQQRRGQLNVKSTHLKENNTMEGDQRSCDFKGHIPKSDIRDRYQRSRTGPHIQHDDHQRKHAEPKRRQGPIKPPKPGAQDEVDTERETSEQFEPGHNRSSHDTACGTGRGSGRHVPHQPRGNRKTHHQNHRPGQRHWDKMPQSKETQTG